ncbi:MAG: hypothetical protein V4596_13905 [Bdellovibrionota bacterium]
MKYLVFCAISLASLSSYAVRIYGDEIIVSPLPVTKILKLMPRDTVGSTADQALTNAIGQCQIYVDDKIKKGFPVYTFRPYANSTGSEFIWHANCEATVK